jgi:hypothetical protein
MSNVSTIERLNIRDFERGQVSRFWLEVTTSGFGNPVRVPVLVARGWEDGSVFGVTAVVHGNAPKWIAGHTAVIPASECGEPAGYGCGNSGDERAWLPAPATDVPGWR